MLTLGPLALVVSGLLLSCLLADAQSCTSCGPECVSACGSRRYRTCCFNYLRKRRSPGAPGAPASELAEMDGPGLEDLRMLVALVANDPEAQDLTRLVSAQTLFHHLLESQPPDGADGGSTEATSPPAPAGGPVASSKRRQGQGGGALAPASRDWLADLRRRVGLAYV